MNKKEMTRVKGPRGKWSHFQTPKCFEIFEHMVVHVKDAVAGVYARDRSYGVCMFQGAPLDGSHLLSLSTLPTANGFDMIAVIRDGYSLDRPLNPSVDLELGGKKKCGTVVLAMMLVRPLFAKDIDDLIDPTTRDWDQTSNWNVSVYRAPMPNNLIMQL